jgi:hypothetical protein
MHDPCAWEAHPETTPIPNCLPVPTSLQGLPWDSQQEAPLNVVPLHPEFEEHVKQLFPMSHPVLEVYATILAVQICSNITLYGLGMPVMKG